MRVLLLTVVAIGDLAVQNVFGDVAREFHRHGHEVYIVNPAEKRTKLPTGLRESCGVTILDVATGNITKSGAIEKGLATISIPWRYRKAIRERLGDLRFDLVIFATPPTTFYRLVEWLKGETGARSYLLLKDIFPQASVDLGVMGDKGVLGIVKRFFEYTEERTYRASDFIGCMTEGNVSYLLRHHPGLDRDRIEINPNSLVPIKPKKQNRALLRKRFGLPADKNLFVYGGNLGKAQDIPFVIDCLRRNEKAPCGDIVIAGGGTDRGLLEDYVRSERPRHFHLLGMLSREEFDSLLCACDVALVFLDHRFTIPNCPSRCLSYMQAGLPIIFATDPNCDFAFTAEAEGFGVFCGSESADRFLEACREIASVDLRAMGERGRSYFMRECSAERSYEIIMEHFNG